MVVDYFHIFGAVGAFWPFKTDAPRAEADGRDSTLLSRDRTRSGGQRFDRRLRLRLREDQPEGGAWREGGARHLSEADRPRQLVHSLRPQHLGRLPPQVLAPVEF